VDRKCKLNILITGAAGFIGRALCDKLIADGYQVRGAARGSVQLTALPSGVEVVIIRPPLVYVPGVKANF